MRKFIDWLRRLGSSYETLVKINMGELKITKKGNVKRINEKIQTNKNEK